MRESGLPEDYLEALDAKRRQLDDSIWKYIASKEREYKNYEKELRHQRRASQGQDGEVVGSGNGNGGRKRRSAGDKERAVEGGEGSPESGHAVTARVVGPENKRERETMDRSSIAGLKDRRASLERDKDFVGVFTPSFLPALSNEPQDTPAVLERTSSTPEQLLAGTGSDLSPGTIERNNSDTAIHAKKPTRPSQLVLQHRNSSSGSSADGRLASAMKSPTQRPKRKRVSLAVGDAIVAPSDNVPSSLNRPSTPSHSRIRQAAAASAPERSQSLPVQIPENASRSMANQMSSVAEAILQAEETAVVDSRGDDEKATLVSSPPMTEKNDFAPMPSTSPSKSRLDPDGDLFDLEHEDEDEDAGPPVADSDEIEDEVDEEAEIAGRLEKSAPTSATSNPIFTPPSGERYDPTTGMIPKPPSGEQDSAVPYLPSSQAGTSQMPAKPGFRRPSVVRDPVFKGSDHAYVEAEQEAVEDETYGSSFVRPSTKGSFTSGSLGESFMERNAEMMERMREEGRVRSAQVRS